jgi:hypothetical protein
MLGNARTCRPHALALALILAPAFPSMCWAQSSSDQAAAEALFDQGRALMAAGQHSTACPKFVESERLDPAPGTLLNLATCYEKNGQIASAWVTFKEAATAARKADQPERARMAHDKVAELEPNLPTLTIVVPPVADRPDLQIRRDGEIVGRPEWGTPIPVDPGTHSVEASGPGLKTWQGSAAVAGPSVKASVEVPVLEAAPAAEPAPGEPKPSQPISRPLAPAPIAEGVETATPSAAPGSTQRAIAWVVGGVGLAGIAVGGIFGGIALSNKTSGSSHCVGSGVCDQDGFNSMQNSRRAATVSDIAFSAGGALLLTGLVLVVTAPRRGSTTATIAIGPVSLGSWATGGLLRASF